MSEMPNPLESLTSSVKDYVDLRLDDLKLRTAKGLSISLNQLLSMILVLFALSIVMLSLAVGLILLIGKAVGSYVGGAFIVGGFFLLVAGVLFLLRNKLFINTFIQLFVKVFFEEEDTDEPV